MWKSLKFKQLSLNTLEHVWWCLLKHLSAKHVRFSWNHPCTSLFHLNWESAQRNIWRKQKRTHGFSLNRFRLYQWILQEAGNCQHLGHGWGNSKWRRRGHCHLLIHKRKTDQKLHTRDLSIVPVRVLSEASIVWGIWEMAEWREMEDKPAELWDPSGFNSVGSSKLK